MNSVKAPLPVELNEEIAALIATLQETGQRLEELTAGEVDTVADGEGRTFVLQRAQHQLRVSEAAKQAAILNALPSPIALLDNQGRIISVNEAWRRFAGAKVIQGPGYGIGFNYLENCDGAPGDGSSEAHQVAEGIRSVLYGGAPTYSIEYGSEQRWFLLTVTPLGDERPNGAVVMHLDITERKNVAEALVVERTLLRTLIDAVPDVVFSKDTAGRFTIINAAALRHVGLPSEEDVAGKSVFDLYPRELADAYHADDLQALSGKPLFNREEISRDSAGVPGWFLTTKVPLHDHAGKIVGMVGTSRDITERKQSEIRIKRLNRVYAVLSGINAAIVRIRDRQELLNEACRIADMHGAFRMAWFGLLNQATGEMDVVASAGFEAGFFEKLTRGSKGAFGPSGVGTRALHERRTFIDNDIIANPDLNPIRRAAVDGGCRSVIGLPLSVEGVTVGSFILYAEEKGFFDDEEIKLLTDLAGDISFGLEFIAKEEKAEYLAYYDVLTGLANRSLFLERVAQYLRSAVSGGHKLAVFFLDLERFRNINDSLGRPAGDALIKQVSEWLSRDAGDPNLLAHLGGDHFAIVVPELKQEGSIASLLDQKMRAFLDHAFRLNNTDFRISIKVGGALFPDDGTDANTLLQNAEAALKKAKASGDRYLFYTQKMTEMVAGKLTLETQLRQALEKEEFVLHYQPKVNLVSGKLTGAEALIRWNDPRTGLVPPGRFIPILEETGLIFEVGRWAFRRAIEEYLRWRATGLAVGRIAVNVSPLQLRNRGFIAEIEQAIGIDPQAASGLELEITESLIMEDVKRNIASLEAIQGMDITIAIDDFGTGFSSLSYLAKLPVDTLKIDSSFVRDMTAGPEGLALVSTIINLAHSLKLKVVAEGVETEEQSRLLRLLDCEEMQGYLFSKPVPSEIFESRFLASSSAGW